MTKTTILFLQHSAVCRADSDSDDMHKLMPLVKDGDARRPRFDLLAGELTQFEDIKLARACGILMARLRAWAFVEGKCHCEPKCPPSDFVSQWDEPLSKIG